MRGSYLDQCQTPSPAATMPRAFLIKKNYSNCPLKKRPVHIADFQGEDQFSSYPTCKCLRDC